MPKRPLLGSLRTSAGLRIRPERILNIRHLSYEAEAPRFRPYETKVFVETCSFVVNRVYDDKPGTNIFCRNKNPLQSVHQQASTQVAAMEPRIKRQLCQ